MQNVISQLDRLKKIYEVRTDTDLAKALQKDKNTVCVWKRRGAIPSDVFMKVSLDESISIDWLINGSGKKEITPLDEISEKISLVDGLLSDERSIKIVQLLPYAPKEFLDQIITRLEEFKKLSKI